MKGRSDAELLQIVVGGMSALRLEHEAEIQAHLPPDFWEQTADLSPPPRGEIGMRWTCAHCYLAEEGMTILRHAGAKSAPLVRSL